MQLDEEDIAESRNGVKKDDKIADEEEERGQLEQRTKNIGEAFEQLAHSLHHTLQSSWNSTRNSSIENKEPSNHQKLAIKEDSLRVEEGFAARYDTSEVETLLDVSEEDGRELQLLGAEPNGHSPPGKLQTLRYKVSYKGSRIQRYFPWFTILVSVLEFIILVTCLILGLLHFSHSCIVR